MSVRQEVTTIPATKRHMTAGGQLASAKQIRVAAYCRVSTDEMSQQSSYATQCRYYTDLISRNPQWTMAGLYADEAISGTSRAKRKEFNRMMDDARVGKIDYIITKSISRFARNTLDTLECVRELRNQMPPVGVFFEKESVDSLDAKGELLLTILSALAQDESRSISDNIRWSFQKKFQAGIPQINLGQMFGYDRGDKGEWLINEPQAGIVRYMYRRCLDGCSASKIAAELNQAGETTIKGNSWNSNAVLFILQNEKYVGDIEMQKTVTVDFLTHQSQRNDGVAPKYYVKNHHPGIVDRFTWNKVQAIFHGRKERREEIQAESSQVSGRTNRGKSGRIAPNKHPLHNMTCGECGGAYHRFGYTSVAVGYEDERSWDLSEDERASYKETYSYIYRVWRCEAKYKGHEKKHGTLSEQERENYEKQCPSPILYEVAIEQSFMAMLYILKREYEQKGESCSFARDFRAACEKVRALCRDNSRYQGLELSKSLRTEAGNSGITALELNGQEGINPGERTCSIMKRSYDLFLECLKKLPETNRAGMKLSVCGRDATDRVYDFLEFDRGIYQAFFPRAVVKKNTIEFITNFGIKFSCSGIDRSLSSFCGFRRAKADGTVELLTQTWQVNGSCIQYRRKKRIYKRAGRVSENS